MRDLKPLLTQALADEKKIVLAAGGDYSLSSFTIPADRDIDIVGNGARLTCDKTINLRVFGRLTIDNIRILQAGVFCEVENSGDAVFLNISSPDDAISEFIKSYSRNIASAHNCDIGITKKVTFYGSGLQIYDCIQRGSREEYDTRWERPTDSGPPTDGFIIMGGEMFNAQLGSPGAKDTLGCREGNGLIQGVKIHGHIRLGQGNQPATVKPGDHCTVKIQDCTFLDNSPGQPYISALAGTDLDLVNTSFISPTQQPIAATHGARVTIDGQPLEKQPAATPWRVGPPTSSETAQIKKNLDQADAVLRGAISSPQSAPGMTLARLPAEKPWAPVTGGGEIVPPETFYPLTTAPPAGVNPALYMPPHMAGQGTVVAVSRVVTPEQLAAATASKPPIDWRKILAGAIIAALLLTGACTSAPSLPGTTTITVTTPEGSGTISHTEPAPTSQPAK